MGYNFSRIRSGPSLPFPARPARNGRWPGRRPQPVPQAMFDTLTQRLQTTLKRVAGQARMDEANIADAARAVRDALVDADVALEVAQSLVQTVRERAVGAEVTRRLNPGQMFVKLVHEELVRAMGASDAESALSLRGAPAVVLLVGLQGAGKTTTAAKLAHWLREREKRSVMLCGADVHRPAAAEQLAALAQRAGAAFIGPSPGQQAVDVARDALRAARTRQCDVLIVDSAGRLAVDDAMMAEARALRAALEPSETLFVIDAMSGQDAVRTAGAFHQNLALSGVVLSKADADTRGGALLSVRAVTGAPLKFIGVGERLDALERFAPERFAARILGMGDVLGLVEDAERQLDRDQQRKLTRKLRRGGGFGLGDMLEQLRQVNAMGGLGAIAEKLPGLGDMSTIIDSQQQKQSRDFARIEALIQSMTPAERRRPEILNGSRKRRITQGAGCTLQDMGRMLKQHKQMQRASQKLKRPGAEAGLLASLAGGRRAKTRR